MVFLRGPSCRPAKLARPGLRPHRAQPVPLVRKTGELSAPRSGSEAQVYMIATANYRFPIFLLVAVFMFAGPMYRQVFHGSSKVFRNWTMFSGIGRGYMDVRFTVVM